ncbi:MAG: CDP-diacylglycerol--glycerol-3-phosphate 3-phosphatidyltransferase [Verrucomicrobia bacterium RIFCSPHIGHO2_12_FULL_41_10]|nr:MAG: CDP-diacylglycerol--glycerol-3-phosphate 3-phosphatidyltransferase [Verrucomicrobia bacterium RIFCSPHIGHO2_12_FULL_41_10]HLB34243.1 CDP-diacylglycerol--glycerol-3-phosphate 3-phosphatidyltransferase [Chthoniobacterales bacterium]
MTLPNQITIGRILLIPVFVLLAIYYGQSVAAGVPNELLRGATIIVFLTAALSDGVDGWLARHYHLKSPLGAILDPLADKGLMLTAIITLSLSNWDRSLPLWFPVLVIARDIIIVTGCIVLRFLNDHLDVRPSLLGKASTFLQMLAIAVVLLQWSYYTSVIWIAGIVTFMSGIGYIAEGVRLLCAGGHDRPQGSSN